MCEDIKLEESQANLHKGKPSYYLCEDIKHK